MPTYLTSLINKMTQKQIWQHSQEEATEQKKRKAASLYSTENTKYSMVPLEMVLSGVLLPCKYGECSHLFLY